MNAPWLDASRPVPRAGLRAVRRGTQLRAGPARRVVVLGLSLSACAAADSTLDATGRCHDAGTEVAAPLDAAPAPAPTYEAPWGYGSDLNNSVFGGFGERDGLVAVESVSMIPGDVLPVFIEPAPPNLAERVWVAEVVAALRTWEDAFGEAGLGGRRFVRVNRRESARIVIGFRAADHVDDCDVGFSRPDATLGHAFEYAHACLAGEIHLNAGLIWVLNGASRGGVYDVRTVVVHELGHLLGLGHVDRADHVMSPAYGGPRRGLEAEEVGLLRARVMDEKASEAER